jgi:hypothetical protein
MDSDDYEVSVYSSKLGIPFSFVAHTHIVTKHAGMQHRYDVFMPVTVPDTVKPYIGTIYKNLLPPNIGFLVLFRKNYWLRTDHNKLRWKTHSHSSVVGATGSPAYKLFQFIETGGLKSYPNQNQYNFILGPNSNSFTQWVVNQFPECNLSLPFNAWGKGYQKK